MSKNVIDEIASASPNRRKFLKTIGAATAGVTAMSLAGVKPSSAQSSTEIEILNFALNLEYLEAEFYTYAWTGKGIESFGIGTSGVATNGNNPAGGVTTGGKSVALTNSKQVFTGEIIYQIGSDERSHVKLLRTALGSQAIAKPDINLNALGFGFESQNDFLALARIFEDIGVSAYAGAAGMLTTPSVITTAARILATEAQHVGSIRTQITTLAVPTTALDGADIIPPPYGKVFQVLSINIPNGLPAIRTPGQVLHLAYGGVSNATKGGFFPKGVNGALNMSSAAATAANLLT